MNLLRKYKMTMEKKRKSSKATRNHSKTSNINSRSVSKKELILYSHHKNRDERIQKEKIEPNRAYRLGQILDDYLEDSVSIKHLLVLLVLLLAMVLCLLAAKVPFVKLLYRPQGQQDPFYLGRDSKDHLYNVSLVEQIGRFNTSFTESNSTHTVSYSEETTIFEDTAAPTECLGNRTDFQTARQRLSDSSWQTVQYSTLYTYSAHMYNNSLYILSFVAVNTSPIVYCQLWYADHQRILVRRASVERYSQSNDTGHRFQIAVLKCQLPGEMVSSPDMVAAVTTPCQYIPVIKPHIIYDNLSPIKHTLCLVMLDENKHILIHDVLKKMLQPFASIVYHIREDAELIQEFQDYKIQQNAYLLPQILQKFVSRDQQLQVIAADCFLRTSDSHMNITGHDSDTKELYQIIKFLNNDLDIQNRQDQNQTSNHT